MSFSAIGGYNAYTQQFAANNTTAMNSVKELQYQIQSQISTGSLDDSVNISDSARRALAALLALQKESLEEECSNPDTLAELITPEKTNVNNKRAEAVIRSLYR
jgi:hypothetical protein